MSKKKGGSGGGSRSSSRGAAAAGAGAGAGGGAGSGSASGGTEQQAAMLRALMQQLGVGGIMSPGVGGGGGGSIFLSREQVLERYRAVYAHTKAGEEQGMYMSMVAGGDPNGALKADTTPEVQLKPITIKQLEPFLGRPAKGRIVRLKTITEACQQSAVQVVEEDEDGTVVNLSLHNVTTGSRRLKTSELNKLYPVGTRLAVKSPYLKIYTADFPGLRLDHAANLIVEGDSDRPLTAGEWKAKGNKHFGQKEYAPAVDAYRAPLKLLDQDYSDSSPASHELRVACHANAAEALLRLDRPFEARVSALGALALDAGHAKARYRLGVALLALRRYGAAEEALVPLLGAGGAKLDAATRESIEAAVARAGRRAADARGDFWASYAGPGAGGGEEEGRARHFLGRLEEGDVGTYFHPALEIRSAGVEARPEGVALMGRGLFVRAAVVQGTVLLVEEATAHVAETDEFERFGMQLDISSMTMDVGGNDLLGREVLQRCMRSPIVNARVLAFFDGWGSRGAWARGLRQDPPAGSVCHGRPRGRERVRGGVRDAGDGGAGGRGAHPAGHPVQPLQLGAGPACQGVWGGGAAGDGAVGAGVGQRRRRFAFEHK